MKRIIGYSFILISNIRIAKIAIHFSTTRNSIDIDTSIIGIGALLSYTPKYTVTANITACDQQVCITVWHKFLHGIYFNSFMISGTTVKLKSVNWVEVY